MNRFHVHLHVQDITQSVGFYSKLFAAEPTRLEADYAKWMLEDPRINFAISTRGSPSGIDHLGFQTDDAAGLAELKLRAQAADAALLDEGATSCCYAQSEKHWVTDPQGIAWEQFHTLADIPVFSEGPRATVDEACCATAPDTRTTTTPAGACAAPVAGAGGCGPAQRGKPIAVAVTAANACC
jgi:hypothetical protein